MLYNIKSHFWFIQKGHQEVDSPAPLGRLVGNLQSQNFPRPGGFCVNVTTACIANLALGTAEETEEFLWDSEYVTPLQGSMRFSWKMTSGFWYGSELCSLWWSSILAGDTDRGLIGQFCHSDT